MLFTSSGKIAGCAEGGGGWGLNAYPALLITTPILLNFSIAVEKAVVIDGIEVTSSSSFRTRGESGR